MSVMSCHFANDGLLRAAAVRQSLKAMLTTLRIPGTCARIRRRHGAIILMYHSVARQAEANWIDPANHVPSTVFEQQMRFLADHRRVVSLQALHDQLTSHQDPDPDSVVITFDDGYLDNLTVAAPILEELGLNATLFIPTAYIDGGEAQWIDALYSMFTRRTVDLLDLSGAGGSRFDLSNRQQYAEAYRQASINLLGRQSLEDRQAILHDLRRQLCPEGAVPALTMGWDEVRALMRDYSCFDLGAHTVGHLDLSAVDEQLAQAELVRSRQRIEDETDIRSRLFSFPYGRATNRLRQLASEAGFDVACGACGDPLISRGVDPLALGRIAAPQSLTNFSFMTSGANTGFCHRVMR